MFTGIVEEVGTVVRIEEQRAKGPIANEDLRDLVAGSLSQLPQAVGVTSQEFRAYAQVRGANCNRWANAIIAITPTDARQFARAPDDASEIHVIGEFIEDHSRRFGAPKPGTCDGPVQGEGPMVLCLSCIRGVKGGKDVIVYG